MNQPGDLPGCLAIIQRVDILRRHVANRLFQFAQRPKTQLDGTHHGKRQQGKRNQKGQHIAQRDFLAEFFPDILPLGSSYPEAGQRIFQSEGTPPITGYFLPRKARLKPPGVAGSEGVQYGLVVRGPHLEGQLALILVARTARENLVFFIIPVGALGYLKRSGERSG